MGKPLPTDTTGIHAYWNLTFKDRSSGDTTRISVPLTSPSAEPSLPCVVKLDGADWYLAHKSLEPGKKLTEAELFPFSSSFVANDAEIVVESAIPGSGGVMTAAYKIPTVTGTETVGTLGIQGDPAWGLTVKVKKRLSS